MATFPPLLRRTAGVIASWVAALLLLQALAFAAPRGAPMAEGGWAPVCAAAGTGTDHAPREKGVGCASFACCEAARPIAFGEWAPAALLRPPRLAPAPPRVADVPPEGRMRRPWSSRAPPPA